MQQDSTSKETIYVIGYPKSGNTWLTRLVGDVLDCSYSDGLDSPEKDFDANNRSGKYSIIKSHYSQKSKSTAINEDTRILYVTRNFCDVLISAFFRSHRKTDEDNYLVNNCNKAKICHLSYRMYFNHQMRRMVKKWQGPELTSIKHAVRRVYQNSKAFFYGTKKQERFYVGNWSDHVNYWVDFPNVVVIRYEDLLDDCPKFLRKALDELKIEYDPSRIEAACQRQSFKRKKEYYAQNDDQTNFTFLRKGIAGDSQRFLEKNILDLIEEKHGTTMRKLGYEI